MNKKKIAILTCWYGSYPWYFPYFIHSCEHNSTVDFIIVTENRELIPNKPNNVKIIHKTLDELKTIFSEKLGFSVRIDYPYKLCDFKPAYGFLFHEILQKYDFWGMGDVDVVYGDIRSFMTEELLNEFDVISSRHDYITGSFCLFKNIEFINKLFKQSKDYKMVFSKKNNYCFDECNYLFEHLTNGSSIFDFPDNIQSMTYVVKKMESEGRLKAFFDFIIVEGNPGNIKWENGKIYYKNLYEAMFYHLILFKEVCKKRTIPNRKSNTLYFTPTRIFTKQP
ncbi:MAG: hypothetical protein Q8R96_04210 [Bacteroidota bacterium]|nr:hypothetical protein [Bacteroidota bacterium]